METAYPTPTVPSTITLLQIAQKNHSQLANGSADTASAPSQQNSTVDNNVDTAASSNSSYVSTPTATAAAIITTPTQAGKEATIYHCLQRSGVTCPDSDHLFPAHSVICLVFIY